MSIRIFNVFLVLALTVTSVLAQEVLSLEDALKYSLENSVVIEKAKKDIDQGNQVIAETRAMALPQISVSSSVTANPLVQSFVLPAAIFGGGDEFMAIRAGQNWTAFSQVQLSQQLFNKQLFTGIKAAKGSMEYYRLLKELSEQNIIQQVAANYYMVIINSEKLNVITSNIERINQLESVVEGQYKAGLARKIDLDRITVNKNNYLAIEEDLRNAVEQQKNLLKYYMGMPIEQEIQLEEFSIKELENSLQLKKINEEYQLEDLLDFKVLEKQKELLEYDRKAKQAEYYPTLSLDANYLYNTQSDEFNLYSSKALSYDMSAVSLRLSIPIFDGFAKQARINQSKIALDKISEDLKNTTNSLVMANKNAKYQLESALRTIENQKANMSLANEVFQSTQNDYENGLATLTDLLNSESDLVAAQNSYNEALLNFKIAEIELIKSRGEIKSLINY